jgi:predicted pyridoxine 5'-phosphate oxidase superfamily flavin-nucleotide-binding protein
MPHSHPTPSDIAFTDAVKSVQSEKGSRPMLERMELNRPWADRLTPDIVAFVGARDSAFLGTASRDGQPYIQHRGGPPGFLCVLDDRTIGFADLPGNRQYITLGNLSENPAAFLFLVDYTLRQRVKLWGTARVVEDDPELLEHLRPDDRPGRIERGILFEIKTWDINCPKHIPRLVNIASVADALAERDARIARLEAQLAAIRNEGLPTQGGEHSPPSENR